MSAIAVPSRKLLAVLFKHLEGLVRAGTCQAGELARHLAPHLGRFGDGEGMEGIEPKELVAPLELMIGSHSMLFGAQ